jgi:hypothetical protein
MKTIACLTCLAVTAGVAHVARAERLGGRPGSSAFKPDPIYGGGRGRDPYGLPLESDPYKPGSGLPKIRNEWKPPNALGTQKKRERRDRDEAAPPPERRRVNPEDKAQDARANRAAREEAADEYSSQD